MLLNVALQPNGLDGRKISEGSHQLVKDVHSKASMTCKLPQ